MDFIIHFAPTLEQCITAARDQRAEIYLKDAEVRGKLGLMAVYRFVMETLDVQTMIDVMSYPNDENRLFRSYPIDKQLFAMVGD
jgi:hypothetical protein